MRNPFTSDKTQVNGAMPPPPPRAVRAPQLPMTLPEQLHPTTHALAQLDAALQEIRRLEGHIEGQDVIIDDLRTNLKAALRDRAMYRGYTIEIRTHLGYLMDSAKAAHSCAMEAAERAALSDDEQPEMPKNLDEVAQTLEEQLREATAGVQTSTEAPAKEGQQ
jgi:hypothetical protein